MSADEKKTFVGFGFGPIQAGLFVYEASGSGNFGRLVVAEVADDLVRAVRANGGRYTVNVARRDRIDAVTVEGVEIYNPRDGADRAALVEAVAASDELATCLPSVAFYDAGDETGAAGVLAEGLCSRAAARPTVIYAAENHNHAAEILHERIAGHEAGRATESLQILNTVIGKMSGVIDAPDAIARLGLKTLTPSAPKAVLVEEFNRILVSRISLRGFRRGIEAFQEKPDLLPFEEAKLYGHNAVHSVIAYLADARGLHTMAEAGRDEAIMQAAREAFLAESGEALLGRHASLNDPLFTPAGYRAYAEDLLERMVNPYLHDLVSRVARDPVRKLGYDDRLYGTMRLALRCGIEPVRLGLGAAAAVMSMIRRQEQLDSRPRCLPAAVPELTREALRGVLLEIWGPEADDGAEGLISRTWEGVQRLGAEGWDCG